MCDVSETIVSLTFIKFPSSQPSLPNISFYPHYKIQYPWNFPCFWEKSSCVLLTIFPNTDIPLYTLRIRITEDIELLHNKFCNTFPIYRCRKKSSEWKFSPNRQHYSSIYYNVYLNAFPPVLITGPFNPISWFTSLAKLIQKLYTSLALHLCWKATHNGLVNRKLALKAQGILERWILWKFHPWKV